MAKRLNDEPKVLDALTALAAVYGKPMSEAWYGGYCIGLRGLTPDQVERAVALAMERNKFMPTPAELRELAGEMKSGDRAIHAWIAFERAVASVGAYRSVDFDDPTLNATIRSLGGWVACCDMPATEFDTFLRQRFLKSYESLYATGVGTEEGSALMGIAERSNRTLGHATKEPDRITTGLPGSGGEPRITNKRPAASLPRVELKRA